MIVIPEKNWYYSTSKSSHVNNSQLIKIRAGCIQFKLKLERKITVHMKNIFVFKLIKIKINNISHKINSLAYFRILTSIYVADILNSLVELSKLYRTHSTNIVLPQIITSVRNDSIREYFVSYLAHIFHRK